YRTNQLTADHELIQLHVHSGTTTHHFYQNNGTETEIFLNNELPGINPTSYFYNLFACSAARFETNNNFGSLYLLANDFCLGVVGSTKTGSMLDFSDFYRPLYFGIPIGEGFTQWWQQNVDTGHDTMWERSWFYGMIILGDPTLGVRNFNATFVGGDVSGTWSSEGNPYLVEDNISVPIDSLLIIEPGVKIIFHDNSKFEIYGQLLAQGTFSDSIIFTVEDTISGWRGLRFYDSNTNAQDSSKIEFCKFEYGNSYGYLTNYGGAISCHNSSDILIKNCVLSNNRANYFGGGIYLENSSPVLKNLIIYHNSAEEKGGGIYCYNSNPLIDGVIIKQNSTLGHGGGIYLEDSNLELSNIEIINNSSSNGGGIHCHNSILTLKNITILNNTALDFGGGISCDDSSLNFDSDHLCNIYLNYAASGSDLYTTEMQNIIIDTFTVLSPTNYHSYPSEDYTFSILHGKLQQVSSDLYVSPQGNDVNDGLSWDSPLKTINSAMTRIQADSLDPHTVYLDSGTFSTNTNGEYFPITCISYVSLQGNGENETSLDGLGERSLIYLRDAYGVSLRNIKIINGLAEYGGGVYCLDSELDLENVVISNNSSTRYGGGIYYSFSNSNLSNVEITGNSVPLNYYSTYGGGICCHNSNLDFSEVRISDNEAEYGGGLGISSESNISFLNVFLTDNQAQRGGGIYCSHSILDMENISITGNEALYNGGGLYCYYSETEMENVIISGNYANQGGGIHLYNHSYATMEHVTISSNYVNGNYGGGVYIDYHSNCILKNLLISGNTINGSYARGGGIYCSSSLISLENVTIKNNTVIGYKSCGGGIYLNDESDLLFNDDNRCNIYANYVSQNYSNDLYMEDCGIVHVILDTFSVMSPTIYYAHPYNSYIFDIQHAKINQINSDLFISVDGDDSNNGLSWEEPLRTIDHAQSIIFADSLNPGTIFLAPGTFNPATNEEQFPIHVIDFVSIIGSGEDTTILQSNNQENVFSFLYVNNSEIKDLSITNGHSSYGGGIYCENSSPLLSHLKIYNNFASSSGGGIYLKNSDPVIENLKIVNNSASSSGGGIYCNNGSNLHLQNVLIANNHASSSYSGGGGICFYGSSNAVFSNVTLTENSLNGIKFQNSCQPIIVNSIFWNNIPHEIYFNSNSDLNAIIVDHSDIKNGEQGIEINDNGTVFWLEGNIEEDPLFVDVENGNYCLHQDSPCIDTGTAYFEWEGEILLDLNYDEYYGWAPDMGAFEWAGTSVNEELIIN
ncbi:MAG TPA: hypothetical protein ENL20_05495, partial [Candidatus Cloacimonetes bacterium]|nr:hypothetical protein [Candidatus Cloacimonadota bacterium]